MTRSDHRACSCGKFLLRSSNRGLCRHANCASTFRCLRRTRRILRRRREWPVWQEAPWIVFIRTEANRRRVATPRSCATGDGDEVAQFISGVGGIVDSAGDLGAYEFAEAHAQAVDGDFDGVLV